MFRKSQDDVVTDNFERSQNSGVGKKIRFNEVNIQQTHHPIKKDYGFMSIPEPKTPFPRHAAPIEAEALRKRLQESLNRANNMMCNENTSRNSSFNEDGFDFDARERRQSEFYKKRKQFYQSEYIIAQQKSMSTEIPEPGPSVGDNWRLVNDGNNVGPSNLNLFINQNQGSHFDLCLIKSRSENLV